MILDFRRMKIENIYIYISFKMLEENIVEYFLNYVLGRILLIVILKCEVIKEIVDSYKGKDFIYKVKK